VRRAFLCGKDDASGRNFDHRKDWVVELLASLATNFAIRICAYAVLSNHFHLVVRIESESARNWSDDEVVRRYYRLFRGANDPRKQFVGTCRDTHGLVSRIWTEKRQDAHDSGRVAADNENPGIEDEVGVQEQVTWSCRGAPGLLCSRLADLKSDRDPTPAAVAAGTGITMVQDDIHSIQRIYEERRPSWKAAIQKLSDDIATRLENGGIRAHLRWRIKDLDSLVDRIRGKRVVNDLLGLRIVVPFQEDIDSAVSTLQRGWNALDVECKADSLSFREFGYDSVHVVLAADDLVASKLPWNCRHVFEVQVRTTLQDAWAEVEHELVYKSQLQIPRESMRKKLAALNALLTLADITFQEIRDQQAEMAEWGRERFHELKRKAAQPETGASPPVAFPKGANFLARSLSEPASELEHAMMAALEFHRVHDYDNAVACYTRALQMDPDPSIRSLICNHRGMALFMLSHELRALEDFKDAVKWNPSNHRALLNRALAWRRLGQIDAALLDFTRALDAGGQKSEVLYLRAQTLVEIGQKKAALAELAVLLELDPENDEARSLMERALETPT